MFRPQLIAFFRKLSSACAACISTLLLEIPHTIKIFFMTIKYYNSKQQHYI